MSATTIKERPIMFKGEMVRAILAGTKTQTRRPVKPQPIMRDGEDCVIEYRGQRHSGPASYLIGGVLPDFGCPYGRLGERLWVRESYWLRVEQYDPQCVNVEIEYVADGFKRRVSLSHAHGESLMGVDPRRRRSAMFMPRWASRLVLEIASVRLERVQDITEEDAKAEGAHEFVLPTGSVWGMNPRGTPGLQVGGCAAEAFALGWDSMYTGKPHAWGANPWVWVVEFRKAGNGGPKA